MIKNDCSNKRVHYEKWAKGNEVNTALSALVHLRRNIINVKTKREKTSNVFPIIGAFDFPSFPI